MLRYAASTVINAPQETIWKILTNAPGYPQWDPGVLRIEGTIAPGKQVTAYTKRDPKRAFPARVSEFVPCKRMVWTGGMPLGLFTGTRTFTLTPTSNGAITFAISEEFTGPMLSLIARSIPDMTPTFEDFVAGLKAFAEKA